VIEPEHDLAEVEMEVAARHAAQRAEILFWDESGFRADTVHGKTWGLRGQTPIVHRPGQRQSMSAASAVSARGEFWFCTHPGGLNGELFVELLRRLMPRRKKAVLLVLDGLPAHKRALVRDDVASTHGKLSLHFLPGCAPVSMHRSPRSATIPYWCAQSSRRPLSPKVVTAE
jgi:hypothetical protein